jgi:hypothetical protein
MALKKFPIYEAGKIEFIEQSGVQDKVWLKHSQLGNVLFKASSIEETPEIQTDWTEKVAYELAKLLDLPATRYELAEATVDEDYDPIRGSFSCSFKLENAEPRSGEEFLSDFYPDYADRYPSTYAVDRVLNALEQRRVTVPSGFDLPTGIDNGAKVFVGYLMLDNLISNCDRHDQNFEIQVLPDGSQELAPTFDQGQAMGATLSDKQRQTFSTQDYHEHLEGSFYDGKNNVLTPRAFEIAASLYPEAARIWQDRLARIDPQQIEAIFDRLPPDRISPTAMRFAKQIIKDGREQLLGLDLNSIDPVDKVTPVDEVGKSESQIAETQRLYHPSRIELCNWFDKLSDRQDIANSLQAVAVELKAAYMAEDFMQGQPEPDTLPDDYRSLDVTISIEGKELLDNLMQQKLEQKSSRGR